ncbi:MAG: hypothetical protein ACO1SV_07290 [Fimbriimonas sp.]
MLGEAGLCDERGHLLDRTVDIDHLAESHRGLKVVGHERSGDLRLPTGKNAVIHPKRRLIVVRRKIYDDPGREAQYREVVAHEVAHDILHSPLLDQGALPLAGATRSRHRVGTFGFSRNGDEGIEAEAIYMGALLLVPIRDLIREVSPSVRKYAAGDWTRMTALKDEAEKRAAAIYCADAVAAITERFEVPATTAKVTLAYWDADRRPCAEWLRLCREVP